MKNLKPLHIGLLTGSLMIAASLLAFYILKLPIESNFQFIIYGLFTAGIIWSTTQFYKLNTKENSFKNIFNAGFKTFVIIAFLMAVFAFIFFSINTNFRDEKIAENNALIIAEGNHLPSEMDENTRQLKKLYLPIMVSSAMFRYLILGTIISIISAGFYSSKNKAA
jgi:uncharacterized membrane protein YdbT with pleckstrin-like domain